MLSMTRSLLVCLLVTAPLAAQGLSNASLIGKYFARQVLTVSAAGGSFSDLRSFSGSIQFDGAGGYTASGQQSIGSAAPSNFSAAGTYSVAGNGLVTISNPLRAGSQINARFAPMAVIGSSTETGGGMNDLFVAVPAPSGGIANASFNGTYWVAGLEFFQTAPIISRATFFQAVLTGGNFGALTVNGVASNLGRRQVTQTVTGATYAATADGSGTATFPVPAGETAANRLISGGKSIFLSRDGNVFLMGSTAAGSHDIVIAVKTQAGVTNQSWSGLYWSAGLRLNGERPGSFAGSANSAGNGVVLLARRARELEGAGDFTGVNRYNLGADGSGIVEVNRFAIGASGNAFLGSGVSLSDTNNFELYVGVRAPAISPAAGPFLNPYGAVNAASFAPPFNPVSPGQYVTLFGSGLAASATAAASTPFPTTLGGVQVLVNDRPCALYYVGPDRVSLLVPQATAPGTASAVAIVGANRSNTIQLPVARTAPGVFSAAANGVGGGAILKTNFSLVTPQNPVRRGDTVMIFLTGLGEVSPGVADGVAAPSSPLSAVTANVNVYIGGVRASVSFKGLSPGLVALYQVNAVIPALAPTGANIPVGIETPEGFTDQVDIAIAP
jgi:uncharacterized protein (TIGR03437 family)